MADATPSLAEFLPRYEADDNEWWRLGGGHHQNLFDEAIERIAEVELQRDIEYRISRGAIKQVQELSAKLNELLDG